MLKPIAANQPSDAGAEISTRREDLKKSCQDFEAIMLNNLLTSMRENVLRAEEPDQAREIYEGMMNECLARELSLRGDMGLAETLYQRLLPLVGGDPDKTSS